MERQSYSPNKTEVIRMSNSKRVKWGELAKEYGPSEITQGS